MTEARKCGECDKPAKYLETDRDAWCAYHYARIYCAMIWCGQCRREIEKVSDLFIMHYEERYCLDCFLKEREVKILA